MLQLSWIHDEMLTAGAFNVHRPPGRPPGRPAARPPYAEAQDKGQLFAVSPKLFPVFFFFFMIISRDPASAVIPLKAEFFSFLFKTK